MEAGTVVTVRDVGPGVRIDDVVEEYPLIRPEHYAEPMALRELALIPGISDVRVEAGHDEFLYVLDGQIDFIRDAGVARDALGAGGAAYVRAGQRYQLQSTDGARVLSFLVPAPGTPWASALEKPARDVVDVARLGAQSSQAASADRQYEVLFDASRGSRGATMFVGFIPTSGAPEHYHLYDEICVIVRGSGTLHARGIDQAIGVGSAFHVAPRLLHALENPHLDDLWVLGVFRPEGSAAAAFYPDGTPAPNNEE
jgi:mannose-6-phosphate isomerase-like protein (cupin superfamily)